MTMTSKFVVGTSGYSFADWVGEFYPPGAKRNEMFSFYAQNFRAVELNYTFYRLPASRTTESLAKSSPDDFIFWVKANRLTTHQMDRSVARPFIEALQPLRDTSKLGGVLLQFPQVFQRTTENRKHLQAAIDDFAGVNLAVEFRHASWDNPAVVDGLRDRQVTLVIPDVPLIQDLFRPISILTSSVGYLRLHSRNAEKWYAGAAARYDYDYSDEELKGIAGQWCKLAEQASRVCVFFNNCHHGQAAKNAKMFEELIMKEG